MRLQLGDKPKQSPYCSCHQSWHRAMRQDALLYAIECFHRLPRPLLPKTNRYWQFMFTYDISNADDGGRKTDWNTLHKTKWAVSSNSTVSLTITTINQTSAWLTAMPNLKPPVFFNILFSVKSFVFLKTNTCNFTTLPKLKLKCQLQQFKPLADCTCQVMTKRESRLEESQNRQCRQ